MTGINFVLRVECDSCFIYFNTTIDDVILHRVIVKFRGQISFMNLVFVGDCIL